MCERPGGTDGPGYPGWGCAASSADNGRAVSTKQVEGIALVVLGLVSLAVTRWPGHRLTRLLFRPPSGQPPANARAVRYVRYVIFAGVILFGAWIATGH